MLDSLTLEHFSPLVGTVFRLTVEDIALDLELVAADRSIGGRPGAAREPFSLLFEGPAEPMLPQGMYAMAHAELGEMSIFVVPTGRRDDAVQYEAVFN